MNFCPTAPVAPRMPTGIFALIANFAPYDHQNRKIRIFA
jgi:hypothetical protein